MKILFAGTPDFAIAPLKNILEHGYKVVGVITQADKPQGRKGVLTPPPVKVFAQGQNLTVLQPTKIRDEIKALKAFGADVMVTCAYGQILTQEVLDCFPKGVWNIHAGLLPKYRGASPIQSCILAGETQTGVCVMQTELGLDTGDILRESRTEILPTETYGELSNRLSQIGAELIIDALKAIENGDYSLQKQTGDVVQTVRKISKEQAKIDFSKNASEIVNLVRGMNPAPVSYAEIDGNKINIYRAEIVDFCGCEDAKTGEIVCDIPKKGLIVKCGDGFVKLTEVQASGGKVMRGADFLNGRKVRAGQVFTC
ncbi:MAG: methionyl-tRNA formyltransferase [Clostridia bacterium]|nr:methionyl-tRNA formyltransferase [Clostridia bacterium]